MKTPRKGTSDFAAQSSHARGKRLTESSRRSKRKATTSDASRRRNSKIRDLPPNENIRKRADEVHGKSTKHSMEWQPVEPKLVVEVQFDHFTGGRFRHGTKFLRWRPEKDPRQCTMEQVERENRSALDLL